MPGRLTTLVIAPEGPRCAAVVASLPTDAFEVQRAADTARALEALSGDRPDAVVLVLEPVAGEVRAVLGPLLAAASPAPVLVVAGPAGCAEALAAGADDGLCPEAVAGELRLRMTRRVATFRALAAARDEAARLRAASPLDEATGLPGPRAFEDRLADEFRRARRADAPLSLVLLGLDASDEAARGLAGALVASVRETDLVARSAPDQLAALLPDTQLGGALTVAERVAASLRAMDPAQAPQAAFGLASVPRQGIGSAEQLARAALKALERARRGPPGTIALGGAGEGG